MPVSPRIQKKIEQMQFREQEGQRVHAALMCYYRRLRLQEEPKGEMRAGYWFPTAEEHKFCCNVLMKRGLVDSRELQRHCKSYSHIASMHEVSAARLLNEIRERTEEQQIDDFLAKAEAATKELETEPEQAEDQGFTK